MGGKIGKFKKYYGKISVEHLKNMMAIFEFFSPFLKELLIFLTHLYVQLLNLFGKVNSC